MASEAPPCVDVIDIQFKLNSKYNLIKQEVNENKGNLLAAASAYGLVIVGSSEPNLKVIQHSRIVAEKDKSVIPSRTIPLPVPPHTIALSCDHSMLAVNFKQNEIPFMTIFYVPSFLSNNIKVLHQNIRLSTDDGIVASQLLWNPVQPNTLAACLSNKSLLVFGFKEQGYDFCSIDKAEQVGCASWSPKGKQIVAGFPNGKIAQYKPDLKIARTIPCTVRLYNTAWDVISIQWLSTYQFAAVMLSKEQDACPALYIVYAPKNGTPSYINYHDICYSQSGPRSAQVILNHILPWNLLLVISANGNEVGVLGTTDTGDNPLWKQYTTLDEARAELPLGANKEDMFPLGIDVDTGTTTSMVVNDKPLPAMPMLHLLSTHGLLISFTILNTFPNCPSICSPPQIVADSSGINSFTLSIPPTVPADVSLAKGDISFGFPTAITSTPRAPPKVGLISSANEAKVENPTTTAEPPKVFPHLFGGQTTIQPISSPQSAFSFVPKSTEPAEPSSNKQSSQSSMFVVSQPSKAPLPPVSIPTNLNKVHPTVVESVPKSESNKPFITVAPTFSQPSQPTVTDKARLQSTDENTISDDDIIKKMIGEEILSYEKLAKTILKRCKTIDVTIGTKEESQKMLKDLIELQDISNQATESTDALSLDIQQLKVSLSETYLMIAEVKSKHSLLNDFNYAHLNDINSMGHTSRRQLEKLQKLLTVNENQYRIVSQQINAHWSSHEENKKKDTRAKMHVPTLENIYQTLTKQRDIISRQRIKINHIKSRLGYKDNINASSKKSSELNITSLTDSMVSMSLCDQVKLDTERLSTEKLDSLRGMLQHRKILQIAPKRPERVGLSSEIVMEKRREQKKKDAAIARAAIAARSTNKTVPPSILKSPTAKVPLNKENTDKSKLSVSFSIDTKEEKNGAEDASIEISKLIDNTVKPFEPAESAQPSISKPATAFGTTAFGTTAFGTTAFGTTAFGTTAFGTTAVSNEKPTTNFGTGLFNNPANVPFATNNAQPSVLFGSTNTAPIPFGSQSSNAIIQKKSDVTKPEKTTTVFDSAVVPKSVTVVKLADKENVQKIEVPKPVLGGITQEKIDAVQKPTVIPFGISASVTTAANPIAPALSFGSIAATKDSATPFAAIISNQASEPPKTSFSIPLAAAPIKVIATTAAPVSTAASNTANSAHIDFTFSLDKMALTPKTTTTTVSALQKPLFNLDLKAETAGNKTSSEDAEKLLDLSFCKPTTPNNEIAPPSSGNFFSMSQFTTPTKSGNAPSIFGGNATSKSPFSNFESVQSATAPTTQTSIFAAPFASPNVTVTTATTNTSSGIFGKADQSPFGQQKTNSIFGGNVSTASTNVFGGSAFDTQPSTATTTFGAPASAFGTPVSNAFVSSTSTTSTFGTPTTSAFGSSASTSNVFGNSAGSAFGGGGNAFSSSKSIFGGSGATPEQTSTFGSTGGSIFGAQSAAAPTSPFGQQAASISTGSLFGSSSFGAQPSTGSIFGGASTGTGSSGFGQSNFGSSFSQQSSPFAATTGAFSQTTSSGFGATFGGQPTFGAAATFGSPKSGFGTFANVANTFGAPSTQQNSLFETLGSSDTGLSFGNIAQSSNTTAPKPAFGGGSFNTWR